MYCQICGGTMTRAGQCIQCATPQRANSTGWEGIRPTADPAVAHATPVAAAPLARQFEAHGHVYKDPENLSDTTDGFLKALAGFTAFGAVLTLVGLSDPEYYYYGEFSFFMMIVRVIGLPLWVGALFMWMRWLYRINENAMALGAREVPISPMGTVLWHLMPVVNVVMPYFVARQTWKIADNPLDWRNTDTPAMIMVWWMTGLVTLFGQICSGVLLAGDPAGTNVGILRGAIILELITALTYILSLMLSVELVKTITKAQIASREVIAGATRQG